MTQTRKIFEHAQELSGRMIVRGVSIGPLPLDEAMALVIRTLDEERDRIEELAALHQAAVQDALAAEAYAEELEAKLAKAANFIVFLDENYRHVFGDTARQKIRELHEELKGQNDD